MLSILFVFFPLFVWIQYLEESESTRFSKNKSLFLDETLFNLSLLAENSIVSAAQYATDLHELDYGYITNKDKKITNGELLAYMDENVSQKASELGRQQNPSLAGDPDKILMSYR